MLFGDLNLFVFFFLILLMSVFINTNTALHLLLTAELLWITLYAVVFIVSLTYDNLNLLSLTFFFLVLSAIEFGIGLVLMLLQNVITRSINLTDNDSNFTKFMIRFKTNLFTNRINWKF